MLHIVRVANAAIRLEEQFEVDYITHNFGHILISPKRIVKRFSELSKDEVSDLWLLAQTVGGVVEKHYKAKSLTMAMQDGPLAGQTVPHVHVHILPRTKGDFEKNDEVYDAVDDAAKDMQRGLAGEKLDLDKERKIRTELEMAEEAAVLRKLF